MKERNREVVSRYLGLRSFMETPILDERKWAKLPGIPADVFFLDMEDSVPPARKEEARHRVVELLGDPSCFGGRLSLARPNHLATPWGREDLVALGNAGVTLMTYPKVQTVEELLEVQAILRDAGADPDIFVLIETARAVLDVAAFAALDKVHGLVVGQADLTVDCGMTLLVGEDQRMNPALDGPLTNVVLAAAAHRCLTNAMPSFPDIRDLDEVRRRFGHLRELGFSTATTFYPSHVEIINELFSPNPADVERASEVIDLYEAALANGDPAVIHHGKALLVHDYEKALVLIARAEAIAGGPDAAVADPVRSGS